MTKKRKLRVGIIFGGRSVEHEVSLRTAVQVMKYVPKDRYAVVPIKIAKSGKWLTNIPLFKLKQNIDVACILLHGSFGEDGSIQGMMETLGIPYTFSGILASSLAMHKAMAQQFVFSHGILVPQSVVVYRNKPPQVKQIARLGSKIVVKPNSLGSSVGVSIVRNTPINLSKSLEKVFAYDNAALVQEYITGVEVTASILGNENLQALPLVEIVPKAGASTFYDYSAKYKVGGSEHIIPARFSQKQTLRIQDMALRVHRLMLCRGVSRSDFMVTPNNEVYFLEVNTIPGMTATSLLPQAANAFGIPFPDLLDRIIQLAFDR